MVDPVCEHRPCDSTALGPGDGPTGLLSCCCCGGESCFSCYHGALGLKLLLFLATRRYVLFSSYLFSSPLSGGFLASCGALILGERG